MSIKCIRNLEYKWQIEGWQKLWVPHTVADEILLKEFNGMDVTQM